MSGPFDKYKMALCATEHEEQCALIEWRDLQSDDRVKLLFAIPNAGAGAQRGQGGKMRAEGVQAGVPDLFLPVASYAPMEPCAPGHIKARAWHGLFIEMKRTRNGTVRQPQEYWKRRLTEEGYCVRVCYGWHEARRTICEYLGIEDAAR